MSSKPEIFIEDYSDKSFVLRSSPKDYFKPFSKNLTALNGRFNPNLTSSDGSGVEPGWIFSLKRKDEVTDLVERIKLGDEKPLPKNPHRQAQTISVPKPKIGGTLYLNLESGNDKIPLKVKSQNGDKFHVTLPDGQETLIELSWQIRGFGQLHSISMN